VGYLVLALLRRSPRKNAGPAGDLGSFKFVFNFIDAQCCGAGLCPGAGNALVETVKSLALVLVAQQLAAMNFDLSQLDKISQGPATSKESRSLKFFSKSVSPNLDMHTAPSLPMHRTSLHPTLCLAARETRRCCCCCQGWWGRWGCP